MKWSKGWEPRFRLHIGFFHSLLGRRLMVAQRENKGWLTALQPLFVTRCRIIKCINRWLGPMESTRHVPGGP
jgi:hypothetical protein